MTWAVNQKCGSAASKLVLLMLANHCNGHTGQCNPRHKTLAEECEMRVETLKTHLKHLESLDLVTIVPQFSEGVQLPNQYIVNFGGVGVNFGGGGGEIRRGGGGEKHPPINQEFNQEFNQEDKHSPIPPAPQAPWASGSKATAISLATWLNHCKASGEQAIPEDDPVFTYAEQAGIPLDMLRLCWIEFRSRYSEPGAKRYKDWRSVYRKAVRGNWLKLWFCNADGYTLTTAGLQAQRALQAKEGEAA